MNNSEKLNRRAALGALGKVGLGATLATAGSGLFSGAGAQAIKKNLDVEVLNFALNLEYLEAAFYLAAVGRLREVQMLGGGAPIKLPVGLDGNRGMQFRDGDVQAYAREIAEDELNHVKFLIKALGMKHVQRPALDLAGAFDAAGQAASGGAIKGFNPFASDLFFLHGAYIFEDVGVTAYNGAATLITNPAYLQAAAGILAVEAYHAGEVRAQLYARRDIAAAAGLSVAQVTAAISALRAKVGGGSDQGVVMDGRANVVPTDRNSIAYHRSTREVLNIVYLAPGAHRGGFFPMGLNGAIK